MTVSNALSKAPEPDPQEEILPSSYAPDFLERVALVSFQKLMLAYGELLLPCNVELIDEQITLFLAIMEALGQRPPTSVIAQWRSLLLQKIREGNRLGDAARLRIAFQPEEKILGLVGGFQVGISAQRFEKLPTVGCKDREEDQQTRLLTQTLAHGTLKMAALPSLLEQHLRQMRRLLEALGQTVAAAEVQEWRQAITPLLQQLFQTSPNAYLVIHYRVLNPSHGLTSGLALDISGEVTSVADEYQTWTHTRTGPLFGSHADAKVLDVADQLATLSGDPAQVPILDIGAGTGRNSLALAQQGFPVDALELAPALADQLTQAKTACDLELSVVQGDILDPQLVLPRHRYQLIFLSEVIASHFRSVDQLRQLFVRLNGLLQPGGILLFNAFLAIEGYQPTSAVRELAQAFWSCVFTRQELQHACNGLPWQPLDEDSVADYEKAHLPESVWPPTDWFLGWATGRNLFPTIDQPPIELRWLGYLNCGG